MLDRRRRILIVLAAIFCLLLVVALALLLHYNSRLSDEIVSAPWRNPIEIVSLARGADSRPVVRVYGDDWRVTEPVRLRDLPLHVPRAFLAAEDVRFYHHFGIDPTGILRALFADLRGGRLAQGASTIPQQLIKGKLFSNERTFRRKIPEMFLAVLLSARMSKDDILEGYMNEVYLGQFGGAPVLGIDEAARIYFDKPPGALTVDEAALIAGIIRAPNRANPTEHEDQARTRRDSILGTMRDQKWISSEELEQAIHRPIRLHPGRLPDTPYGHYLSAMRTELASIKNLHLPRSGARIFCAMEPTMQLAAEATARRGLGGLQARYSWLRRQADLQIAILSADPRTGAVRALVGSRDFSRDSYDRTRRMHRQPGSAIKPFVYAAALASKKFTTSSVLLDEPLQIRLDRRRVWEPHDYDNRFRGPVMLRTAVEKSLNVPAVRVGEAVGLPKVIEQLKKFGFDDDFEPVPSLPLGVTDVTLRELVSGYSVFPTLGESHPLHIVEEVRDIKGRSLYKFKDQPERVLDPPVAWIVHDLLRGVVGRGTASRLVDEGLGFVAGKTGTTSDYRDAWFIGYSPDLVTGLWVGCDGGTPIRLSAGEAAVPLWSEYARHIRMQTSELPPPAGVVFQEIDPSSGGIWEDGCEGPVKETYLTGTEPRETCHGEPLTRRALLARAAGNPEPGQISEEQSRSLSQDTNSDTSYAPESPDVQSAPQPGRIPEIVERDDEESDNVSAQQSRDESLNRSHRKKHHSHRSHHRRKSFFRRIFG